MVGRRDLNNPHALNHSHDANGAATFIPRIGLVATRPENKSIPQDSILIDFSTVS